MPKQPPQVQTQQTAPVTNVQYHVGTQMSEADALAQAFAVQKASKGNVSKAYGVKPTADAAQLRQARAEAREKRQATSRFKEADKLRKRDQMAAKMVQQMMKAAQAAAAIETNTMGADNVAANAQKEDDERVLNNIASIEEEFYDVANQFSNDSLGSPPQSPGGTTVSF